MKKIALVIVMAAFTMFAAGQTKEEVKQMLTSPETRLQVMDQIAGDVTMSHEMMSKIMDAARADTAMRHHMMSGMMNACKADTTMRNCMMSQMMNACQSDSAMMKSMHRHMMGKPKMKDPMENRMKESNNSKAVEGLDKTTLTVIKKDK